MAGLLECLIIESNTNLGVGISGSPIPKEITSIPCFFFSAIVLEMPTNKYGSIVSNLFENFIIYSLIFHIPVKTLSVGPSRNDSFPGSQVIFK